MYYYTPKLQEHSLAPKRTQSTVWGGILQT